MDFQELIRQRNTEIQFLQLVGITITEMDNGYAAGEIILQKHHQNLIGSVHGGCIFSLADTVSGAAAMSYGNPATTLSSDFHFLAPAITCTKLTATASEIKHGKTITVFDVEIRDENETLLARGTFSYYNLENKDTITKSLKIH